MAYETYIFADSPEWSAVPVARIDRFHWEGLSPYRPECYAKLCGVTQKGLYAKLWAFEENPRCIYTETDDPVYKDSCLELFLQPVTGNEVYVNFEVNCRGVFLAQAGAKRSGRVFLKDISPLKPDIAPFSVVENGSNAWGVDIHLSEEFLTSVYNIPYRVQSGNIRGNFYKCGDDTPKAHYAAHFPVSSPVLGFHNPKKFGTITLTER